MNHIHPTRLALALALGLAMAAQAQAQDSNEETKDPKQLDRVEVTGSLLPQSSVEGASPMLTITAEEMRRHGFGSVAEALKSTTFASGSVRDSTPVGGGNAQGTKMVNLFGLGARYTKVLINGHPVASFPLNYNTGGGGDFTDLSKIPTVMVERIEILPGSQSAIYGSDAISGVINIILKQDMDGTGLNYRTGGYSEGGGSGQRLQVAGGKHWSQDWLTYALEFAKNDPVIATDRKLTARRAYEDDALAYNNATGVYVDPGEQGCSQMSALFGGTMAYHGGEEPYCGSDYTGSYATTFEAQRKQATGYLSFRHDFDGDLTAYADLDYAVARNAYSYGIPYYWNLVSAADGNTYRVSREFAPEEIGGDKKGWTYTHSHQYDLAAGLRGGLGSTPWSFDLGYSRSYYLLKFDRYEPVTAAMNSYLGAKYAADITAVFAPLTPEEYASFSTTLTRRSKASTDQLSGKLTNTDLFELPGGSAGLALLVEGGREDWDDEPDANYQAGATFSGKALSSNGSRDHYGGALQLDLPLWSMLRASAAWRYDNYSYSGHTIHDDTWRLGLEFRPLETLLVRGALGTSFKAPDMSYLFLGSSTTQSNNYDLYRCDQLGVSRTSSACRYVMTTTTQGDLELKPVTAKSKSVGIVWSPLSRLNLHADYLDIEIHGEISAVTSTTLLTSEASCREGGDALTLPSCDYVYAHVARGSDGKVTSLAAGYTNVAYKRMKSLISGLDYSLPTDRWGEFGLKLSHTRILDYKYQADAYSSVTDVFDNPKGQSAIFRSIVNAGIDWDIGPWSASVYGIRYGKTPNYALLAGGYSSTAYGTPGYDDAWLLFNASLRYAFGTGTWVSLAVSNVGNKMPPSKGWLSYPYYNSQVYNVYGREISLEFNTTF